MKNENSLRKNQTEVLYREFSRRIYNYVYTRVENREDAENISQDVWVRLLESKTDLCLKTAVPYIYKIASNLVNDYLRLVYVRMGVREDLKNGIEQSSAGTPHEEYSAIELSTYERRRIECLPRQRRIIYIMSRFEGKTVAEIAETLSLSIRTVENHLRMGRKEVREYITAIA